MRSSSFDTGRSQLALRGAGRASRSGLGRSFPCRDAALRMQLLVHAGRCLQGKMGDPASGTKSRSNPFVVHLGKHWSADRGWIALACPVERQDVEKPMIY